MGMINSPDFIVFRRGVVYEGDAWHLWAVYPRPLIIKAIWSLLNCQNSYRDRIFLEDSFDPVTRTRRGRFYGMNDGYSTQKWDPTQVANGPYGQHVGIAGGIFDYDGICEIASVSDVESTRKEIVRLGLGTETTYWRVTDIERNVFGQQVFILRAQSLFGVLPEIKETLEDKNGNVLEEGTVQDVRSSLAALVDTYHRFQAVPTVDVARESTRVILAKWIGQEAHSKDLGYIISKFLNEHNVLTKSAFIVNRLHPRGKTAEQESQSIQGNDIREPTEDDARASVELVGMILREIGWDAKHGY
jgi:hypothetical protein